MKLSHPACVVFASLIMFVLCLGGCVTPLTPKMLSELSNGQNSALPGYIDMLGAKLMDATGSLLLEIDTRLAPPQTTTGTDLIVYTWFFDTDQNLTTGHFLTGIGADYIVRVTISASGATGGVEIVGSSLNGGNATVAIDGTVVQATIALAQLGNPVSFNWAVMADEYAATYAADPISIVKTVTLK